MSNVKSLYKKVTNNFNSNKWMHYNRIWSMYINAGNIELTMLPVENALKSGEIMIAYKNGVITDAFKQKVHATDGNLDRKKYLYG